MNRYLVTIGTFDGVHRGHRKLMRWVIARARSQGLKTRVVLFREPPRFYFRPDERLPLLTDPRDRANLLRSLGIEKVEVLRFGPRWAQMPHGRFFEDYVIRRWRAGGLLVGRDFAFGKGRKGDLAYLRSACKARSLSLGVLPLVRLRGLKVSSSRVRELLGQGDVGAAAKLLGRDYSVTGKVVRGRGLGRSLGFPTANLSVAADRLVPRGVYSVKVSGGGLLGARAALNCGTRPTVSKGSKLHVEVHIPGFSGNLYGKSLSVVFIKRIRPEKRFPSIAALTKQIRRDLRSLSRR